MIFLLRSVERKILILPRGSDSSVLLINRKAAHRQQVLCARRQKAAASLNSSCDYRCPSHPVLMSRRRLRDDARLETHVQSSHVLDSCADPHFKQGTEPEASWDQTPLAGNVSTFMIRMCEFLEGLFPHSEPGQTGCLYSCFSNNPHNVKDKGHPYCFHSG